MNDEVKAKCTAFVNAAVDAKPKVKGAFGLDFLDGPIAAVIQGLNAAKVGLDVIIEWVPRIAAEVLTFSKSVQEIIADILSRLEAKEAP